MINRSLTEKIKSECLKMGMDLVGFGPVERWKNAPFLLSPKAILPTCNSVVVTGMHITDTWTEMGGEPTPHDVGPGGWMDQNSLLDRVAFRITHFLREYGYDVVAVASSNIWRYRKFEGIESLFAPDISHIHASATVGLSQIGWNGLAITPEYGPRVRYISIMTSAELEPTPLYNGPNLCDMCMDCVRACPTEALKRDFNGTPHIVKVEDKVFKYANKNIWRCAWAEHFNLNLKSDVLKKDHIDETDVLKSVNCGDLKGHERGVCQKVCIPPHLRSDAPSFGRKDKKITMRKVNRKYNEDMPTLRKMRDDIIAKAVALGIDIAAVNAIDKTNRQFDVVEKEAPGMITAIAFGMRIPAEIKEACAFNTFTASPYNYAIRRKMHQIMLVIAKFVEEFGYHATAYTGEVPKGKEIYEKALMEEKNSIENKEDSFGNHHVLLVPRLAQLCGLGTFEDEFYTEEFGSNVMLGVIATDAPLDRLLSQGYEYREPAFPTNPVKMKNKLAQIAETNLVDLFGVCKSSRIDDFADQLKQYIDTSKFNKTVRDIATGYAHGQWISEIQADNVEIFKAKDYLEDAKSVITLGMTIPQELMENIGEDTRKQIGTYGFYTYQTTYELYFAAMEMAGYLNRCGYKTMVTSNLLGIGSMVDTPRELLPDFRCSAVEAVACGLGEIGKNGGLLTQEAGAHQRCITIITNLDIPSDEMYSGEKLCTECNNCISHCPMNVLKNQFAKITVEGKTINYPIFDQNRCDWAKKYSLCKDAGPEMIGNYTNFMPKGEEVTLEEIADACNKKDQVMKHRTVVIERCIKECSASAKK